MSEIYSKMIFPNTIEEYFKDYAFIDEEQIYTNGSELIPTFRVKQWEEHKDKEIERLNNIIKEAIEYLESYNTDFKNCRFGEAPISIRELGDLLDILKGSDKE